VAHYVILAKYIEVNEDGDENIINVTALSVEHSSVEAISKIQELEKEYKNSESFVIHSEDTSETYEINVIPEQEIPSFYIKIYFEEVE
jgi:hypothetical protein